MESIAKQVGSDLKHVTIKLYTQSYTLTNSLNPPHDLGLHVPRCGYDVNFCKDHRDKTEVPDPLADLIGCKLNNKRKLARLIIQYRDIFSNISEGTVFLLQCRLLLRVTLVFNVTNLKYGKYDLSEKINISQYGAISLANFSLWLP